MVRPSKRPANPMPAAPRSRPTSPRSPDRTTSPEHDEWPPIPWEAISQLGRPSVVRYRRLIEALVRADQAAEAGVDKLDVLVMCVASVVRFIDADLAIRGTGLTRSLSILAGALQDLRQGARPRLFFERPRKGPGRPTNLIFEGARGAIAAAVAVLIKEGESRADAGKFVADQSGKTGVRLPDGNTISSKQVLGWYDDIDDRAQGLAEDIYRNIISKYQAAPREALAGPARRRALVAGFLLATWARGF